MKKETSDSMGKAGKTFAEISLRITLYGGAFILVGIAGFFIYDVLIPSPFGEEIEVDWGLVADVSSARTVKRD
jgi:hypothetical protein